MSPGQSAAGGIRFHGSGDVVRSLLRMLRGLRFRFFPERRAVCQRMTMMCEKLEPILELEDILRLDVGVTIGELLHSPLLPREANGVAEGLALDLAEGLVTEDQTAESLLYQDVLCSCRKGTSPCLKDGGSLCYAVQGENSRHSIFGGKKAGYASCEAVCPIGVDVPGIMQLMREGALLEARRTLMKYLPMAKTVCLSCGRCGANCVRQGEGAPVAAHRVMDWLGETISDHPEIFFIPPSGDSRKWIALERPTMASLSAAYYLRRMGNHVVFFHSGDPEELLAPYGAEAVRTMAAPLGQYLENLQHMGALFEPGPMEERGKGYSFHQTLCLELPGEKDLEHLLREIAFGVEEARKVNLSYGLKSFLEPGSDFCTFDRYGIRLPPENWFGKPEDGGEKRALQEASRCLNCSCQGVSGSSAVTALLMLETAIVTDRRTIRAQDYFTQLEPWKQFQQGEQPVCLEIPKSGDFLSGCLRQGEITLCYAFFLSGGKIRDLRLMFGGVAPVPIRLSKGERYLQGKEICSLEPGTAVREMMKLLEPELSPMEGNDGKMTAMEQLLEKTLKKLCK